MTGLREGYQCGEWCIGEQIGQGSEGMVFEARRSGQPSGDCCIKVTNVRDKLDGKWALLEMFDETLAQALYEKVFERCMNEIVMMEKLASCPYTVHVEEYWVNKNENDRFNRQICIRMKKHTPLKEVLRTSKEDRKTLARKVGMDICRALAACEEAGIVHQDVKEENIFMDRDGRFLLGDFGISFCEETQQPTGISGGTLKNLSPEVYAGETSTHLSDLYALGMVLYRILNNDRDPFEGENRRTAFRKRMEAAELPMPQNADQELGRIVLKACAREPRDRYLSARQMLAALEGRESEKGRRIDFSRLAGKILEYCAFCGNRVAAGDRYCMCCGTRLNGRNRLWKAVWTLTR